MSYCDYADSILEGALHLIDDVLGSPSQEYGDALCLRAALNEHHIRVPNLPLLYLGGCTEIDLG